MTREHKGYQLFDHIEDPTLRTWNRCAVLFNIMHDRGPEMVEGYANELKPLERAQMFAMFKYIQVKGYETVRSEINRGETKAILEA
ncbi:hypothetical protein N9924_01380 [bacterium]|nr:hypothetical protein [bacterium]